ncbi:MAG: hypothetical protein N3F67_02160 [Acidilobaceae archaeon]|nr:hypothetical protein [Acidilobaceae archaeon]
MEFEVVEEYVQHDSRRFKVRVKGTKVIINVSAESAEEALGKAREMWAKMRGSPRT